jgi:hypothetical protein
MLPSLQDYETAYFPLSLMLKATVRNSPIKADKALLCVPHRPESARLCPRLSL